MEMAINHVDVTIYLGFFRLHLTYDTANSRINRDICPPFSAIAGFVPIS